ncbi:hypothetical protein V1288_002108 [Bradyrhizobium sp. AZCC 2176]
MTRKTPVQSARVEARPTPESWDMDELMTLKEAVDLHWPQGPITVATLRTAIRDGQLAVCAIAGKFFLTRRLLLGLSTGRVLPRSREARASDRLQGGMTENEARAVAGLPPR